MKKTIIAAAALIAMVGCNKELIGTATSENGYGYINLGVSADNEMIVTKAGEAWENYSVTLTPDGEGLTGWTKTFSAITAADKTVAAGSYTVSIENVSAEDAYSGMGQIRVAATDGPKAVNAGGTTTFTLACTPVNSKISFVYTEGFAAAFNEDAAVVTLDPDVRDLTMVMEQVNASNTYTTMSQAYFEPQTGISWKLNVSNADNTAKEYTGTCDAVKGKWTIVQFDSNGNGQIEINVTVSEDFGTPDIKQEVLNPLQ